MEKQKARPWVEVSGCGTNLWIRYREASVRQGVWVKVGKIRRMSHRGPLPPGQEQSRQREKQVQRSQGRKLSGMF